MRNHFEPHNLPFMSSAFVKEPDQDDEFIVAHKIQCHARDIGSPPRKAKACCQTVALQEDVAARK